MTKTRYAVGFASLALALGACGDAETQAGPYMVDAAVLQDVELSTDNIYIVWHGEEPPVAVVTADVLDAAGLNDGDDLSALGLPRAADDSENLREVVVTDYTAAQIDETMTILQDYVEEVSANATYGFDPRHDAVLAEVEDIGPDEQEDLPETPVPVVVEGTN